MDKPRRKLFVLFGGVALILSGLWTAQGQVNVYNPGIYNRTRNVMSNRAAARAALRKARQRAAMRKAAQKRRQAIIKRRQNRR